jgi:hypothetical protein
MYFPYRSELHILPAPTLRREIGYIYIYIYTHTHIHIHIYVYIKLLSTNQATRFIFKQERDIIWATTFRENWNITQLQLCCIKGVLFMLVKFPQPMPMSSQWRRHLFTLNLKLKYLYCCTVHFEDSLSIAHQQMH